LHYFEVAVAATSEGARQMVAFVVNPAEYPVVSTVMFEIRLKKVLAFRKLETLDVAKVVQSKL
jgi:hypothetical protein